MIWSRLGCEVGRPCASPRPLNTTTRSTSHEIRLMMGRIRAHLRGRYEMTTTTHGSVTARTDGTRIGKPGIALEAGNRAQELIDRSKVVIRHTLVHRPRHHHEIRSVLRVRVIGIVARAHD